MNAVEIKQGALIKFIKVFVIMGAISIEQVRRTVVYLRTDQ